MHFDAQESIAGFAFGSAGADVVFAPKAQYQTNAFIIKVETDHVGDVALKTIYLVVLILILDLYVYTGQLSEKRYRKVIGVVPYVIGVKLDFVV